MWTKEQRKEYMSNYQKIHPETHRKAMRKYRQTHKKKIKEYNKIYSKTYCQTHKEQNNIRNKKWKKTLKGKISNRKNAVKHRGLGFIPLNEPFEGSHGHHIDKELVIYIPKDLHDSVRHNIWTGKGMEEINELAFEYMYRVG
jgi:hypothetical protein